MPPKKRRYVSAKAKTNRVIVKTKVKKESSQTAQEDMGEFHDFDSSSDHPSGLDDQVEKTRGSSRVERWAGQVRL